MDDHEQQWQAWFTKLAEGDQQVFAEFWQLYGDRLFRLAEKHLALRLQRRVGPEDIVQSACRTFFRRVQRGDFQLADSENLWRLLCAITLAKVRWHARFHLRKKRGVNQERHLESKAAGDRPAVPEVAGSEPTPEEAAVFTDELEQILTGMDEEERQLVQFKLEQYTNDEIAERMNCSERTVRRMMKRIQSRLTSLLEQSTH